MDASRYRWTIKTSDDLYSGNDPGQVFLSLHGLDGAMKEMRISQTKALGQFAKGSEETGVLTVPENLGALQTGTLRCTGRWKVSWVKVRCLDDDDGRTWQADVEKWDNEGRFPMLRFQPLADDAGHGDDAPAAASESPADAPDASDAEDPDPETEDTPDDPEIQELQAKLDQLNRALAKLRLQKAVAEKQKEFEQAASPAEPESPEDSSESTDSQGAKAPPPPAGRSPAPLKTFEVIARIAGRKERFTDAVLMLDGTPIVLPGVTLSVGNAPEDGFGLGGTPGRWSDYYPSSPPEVLGLPPGVGILIYDGTRGHALDPATLQGLLGPDWRSQFTP